MTPYERVFAPRQLNGVVVRFERDLASFQFTNLFKTHGRPLKTNSVAGVSFEWDEVVNSRALAPIVGIDSPAPGQAMQVKVNRTSAVAAIKVSKKIPTRKLWGDRAPGELFANAQAVVDSEMQELVGLVLATLEYLCVNALNGTITVNATNIPGTTQVFTVTFSPNTYTASATWATAATDLLGSEFPAAKQDFFQTWGGRPAQVYMGATIDGYIRGNTAIQTALSRRLEDELLKAAAPLGGMAFDGYPLANLDWLVNEEGYVPAGGSFTRFIPATDDAFMLPENNRLGSVLGLAEGHVEIPGEALVSTPSAAGSRAWPRFAEAPGMQSYAIPGRHDVELIVEYPVMPVLLDPSGVMVMDVVP